VTAPCDPGNDRCCAGGSEEQSAFCKDVSDIYPSIGNRCCIPNRTHPCSGGGGGHCAPGSACSMCCSGWCSTEVFDSSGDTWCTDPPA
jgi:hypothetical protein